MSPDRSSRGRSWAVEASATGSAGALAHATAEVHERLARVVGRGVDPPPPGGGEPRHPGGDRQGELEPPWLAGAAPVRAPLLEEARVAPSQLRLDLLVARHGLRPEARAVDAVL